MSNQYDIFVDHSHPTYLNYVFTIKLLNIIIPNLHVGSLYSNIRVFKKNNILYSFFFISNSSSIAKNILKHLTTETNIFHIKSKTLLNNEVKYELIITQEFIQKHIDQLLEYI